MDEQDISADPEEDRESTSAFGDTLDGILERYQCNLQPEIRIKAKKR